MSAARRLSRGFTLIELLVVMAIIGVLIAMLAPAVQKVRESANRVRCLNNLRQLAIGMQHYHTKHEHFPPGFISNNPGVPNNSTWCRSGGGQGPPWTLLIMPYIDKENLYKSFDLTKKPFTLNSWQVAPPNNAVLIPVELFRCPSDHRFNNSPHLLSYYGVQGGGASPQCGNTSCSAANQRAYYVNGLVYAGSKVRISMVADGTSNVFLIGETRYGNTTYAAAGKQDGCAIPHVMAGAQEPINLHPNQNGVYATRGFSSYHDGGCHFAMGDGSTRFISENIDLATYQQLAKRNDGLPDGGYSP